MMSSLSSFRQRFIKGLGSSPTYSGLFLFIGILAIYWAILAMLATRSGIKEAWMTLGVPGHHSPFVDFRIVLFGCDLQQQGMDPLNSPPGAKYNPNYPRIWYLLGRLGLSENHTFPVGATLVLCFYLALIIFLGRMNMLCSIFCAAIVCSPPLGLAVERANNDLVIFIILSLAVLLGSRPPFRLVMYSLIFLAGMLKLYPIFAATTLLLERSWRRFLLFAAPLAVLFAAYCILTRDDLVSISRLTPRTWMNSFGCMTGFQFVSDRIGSGRLDAWVQPISLCAAFAVMGLALWHSRKLPTLSVHGVHGNAFLVGAGIYLSVFIIGNNWDYRLVFLLLTVPQLLDWASQPGRIGSFSLSLLIGGVLLSCWGMYPLYLLLPRFASFVKLMANWYIFWGLTSLLLACAMERFRNWRSPKNLLQTSCPQGGTLA
jgi:hypothetical protein